MKHQLKGNLQQAIIEKQYQLHYQPKVFLKTGEIVATEALLRWEHPDFGIIKPESFLGIAEETGDIISIGEWVFTEACLQNKKWHDKGYKLIVSVNVSALQLSQTNLVGVIAKVLEDTGLKPEYLEVEFPESIAIDYEHVLSMFKELKGLGVRISIDNFGIGIWSLRGLSEIPVDTLILDQSFVQDLQRGHKHKSIVKAVLSMARHLKINIAAKGIETKEQLHFLQQQSCQYGQGFLFGKPKTANEFEKKFKEIEQKVSNYQGTHHQWAESYIKRVRRESEELDHLQENLFALKRKLAKNLANRSEM